MQVIFGKDGIIMLGQEIKKARCNMGMSQNDLATRLGVSRVAVCWYESGKRSPQLDKFMKISEILNVSPAVLLGLDQEVSYVSEGATYSARVAKKDLEIINELKKYPSLYEKIYADPIRCVKLIDKKMK